MTGSRWVVLVNPSAGRTSVTQEEVTAAFTNHGVNATVTTTRSAEHLRSVVEQEAFQGSLNFAVVGGDGTAHHALNAMLNAFPTPPREYTLSIIPAGSGSDFIRTFGHDRGLDAGIERLREPDRYRIDVGSVSGSFGQRYFLNALNIGVAAASAATAEKLPRVLGPRRYTIGFWLALSRFSPADIEVAIDHHTFKGEALNVVAANGQFFGGGMNIAPRATLTDGLLDVQVFAGRRRKAFTVMPRVIRGSHLSHTAVRRYIGASISLEVTDDWLVEADGEILGNGSVQVATIPSVINFIA